MLTPYLPEKIVGFTKTFSEIHHLFPLESKLPLSTTVCESSLYALLYGNEDPLSLVMFCCVFLFSLGEGTEVRIQLIMAPFSLELLSYVQM